MFASRAVPVGVEGDQEQMDMEPYGAEAVADGVELDPTGRPWWCREPVVARLIATTALLLGVECAALGVLALTEGANPSKRIVEVSTTPARPATVSAQSRVAVPIVATPTAAPEGPMIPTEPDGPLGYRLFVRAWLPDDPRCHGGDGLGPVYNDVSCLACHGQGGPGGSGPLSTNVDLIGASAGGSIGVGADRAATGAGGALSPVSRALLARVHPGLREALSTTLHRQGTSPGYADWRAQLLGYEAGREPAAWPFAISGCQYGPAVVRTVRPAGTSGTPLGELLGTTVDPVGKLRLAAALLGACEESRTGKVELVRFTPVTLLLSRRNPPPLFGSGAIDAIPEYVIVANGEQSQRAFPEVTGRPSRARDGRIGRFGWKAQIASLSEFVASACAGELGLEVPGRQQAASPLALEAPAKGLDMTQAECDALTEYVRRLPAPVVDEAGPDASAEAGRGRELFTTLGCAACHTPDLGEARGIYSDVLLHDMGIVLADDSSYYSTEPGDSSAPATGTEWRTAPLWGLRDSGPYLHDGRARTIEEAIAAHGGEADGAALRYAGLPESDRASVDAFLLSLAAPPPERPAPAPSAAQTPPAGPGPDWTEGAFRKYDEALHEGLVTASTVHRTRAEAERVRAEARAARARARAAPVEQFRADANRQAAVLYEQALLLDREGDRWSALEALRQAARDFPETDWGEQARRDLATLESRPAASGRHKRPHR